MTFPRGVMSLSAVCDCGIITYYFCYRKKRGKSFISLIFEFGLAHCSSLSAIESNNYK